MKSTLKFLANPLYTGGLALLFAFTISSHDKQPADYLSGLLFIFLIFCLPFMIISSFTRVRLEQPAQHIRLTGLWIGSIGAALVWTAIIKFDPNPQAGLGFMFFGIIALCGGIIGYLTFWLSAIFNTRQK